MTLSTALFIFAAQLLAYLVKGLIGFGNPLISAPILSSPRVRCCWTAR